MKLTKRESQTVLAALAVAEAWEDSLMDANKHCPEYVQCKRRRAVYISARAKLGRRYREEFGERQQKEAEDV